MGSVLPQLRGLWQHKKILKLMQMESTTKKIEETHSPWVKNMIQIE